MYHRFVSMHLSLCLLYITILPISHFSSSSSNQLFLFLGHREPQLLADPWPHLSRRGDKSFLLPPVALPMPSSTNVQNFHDTSTSVRKLAILACSLGSMGNLQFCMVKLLSTADS